MVMKEEDKIFAGYMFDPRKQELKDIKHRAHEACRRFNSMAEYAEEIHIGDDVWIACNAVVIGGVTIGDDVVIGAGSVVTKDIPSGYLAYGNPCRPVRRITEADSMKHLILPEDTEHFTYNLR